MRSSFFPIVLLLFAMVICPSVGSAQGGAKSGPDPSTIRDPDLERDSLHNLEVARLYFKLKKAYVAALQRCEEIIAGNPTFARMDEVLYIAGTSSLNLADNKGKQPSSLYGTREGNAKRTFTRDEFRELGRNYLTQLVTDYPQSSFSKQAEEPLRSLGGPKAKAETKQ